MIEINSRRNPFVDMAEVGELLEENGRLTIALLQHRMRIGYTYARHILDYLLEIGELYRSGDTEYLSARLTPAPADLCPSCGSSTFAGPDAMGSSFCLQCGTSR